MSVHENLKKRRKELGLTQYDVSRKLGISRQAISKWENEDSYPDIDNLILLSKLYGVSVDDLLKGNNIRKPKLKNKSPMLFILSVIAAITPPIGGIAAAVILKKMHNNKYERHKKTIVFLCKISILLSFIVGILALNALLYLRN